MSDVPTIDARGQRIALAAAVACLAYGVSLALQRVAPGVRDFLALDLGPGVRPTYYSRSALSVLVGAASVAVARPATPRSESAVVRATALALGLALLLVLVFP